MTNSPRIFVVTDDSRRPAAGQYRAEIVDENDVVLATTGYFLSRADAKEAAYRLLYPGMAVAYASEAAITLAKLASGPCRPFVPFSFPGERSET